MRQQPRMGRRSSQQGFGLLELTIAVLFATVIGIGVLQRQVAQIENEFAQVVAAEIFTIHDAARTFYARNNVWPDELNDCADALDELRTQEFLVGFDTSRWGTPFTTECIGGPPRTLFRVTVEAPNEQFARVTGSRVIGAEINLAEVSSTIPVPGAEPLADSDRFLHRIEVPGRPDLNWMLTTLTMGDPATPGDGQDLDMNGNRILNVSEITSGGGDINFGDQTVFNENVIFNANTTFNGNNDFQNGLRWGNSRLSVVAGHGIVDLSILGGQAGLIRFYSGGLQGSLEARAGLIAATTGFRVDGALTVGGTSTLDGQLLVNAPILAAGPNGSISAEEEITAGLDITACNGTADECAIRVGAGGNGRSLALGYDGAQMRLWGGGGINNPIDAFIAVANIAVFDSVAFASTGDIQSAGVVSGVDVRTETGDSLTRAVQDVTIVPNQGEITKPICGPLAPTPSIFLAVSQVAAGDPAPPMHQIVTFASDLGDRWRANMVVLTQDGLASPPALFGQMMAVVKCDI